MSASSAIAFAVHRIEPGPLPPVSPARPGWGKIAMITWLGCSRLRTPSPPQRRGRASQRDLRDRLERKPVAEALDWASATLSRITGVLGAATPGGAEVTTEDHLESLRGSSSRMMDWEWTGSFFERT
jgi:hypothetical protein